MKEKIISEYINKITLNDINNFASNHNIILNNYELNLIYNYLKNDWKNILFGNCDYILSDLKKNLNNDNYKKIINLFNYYKNIYL